MSESTLPKRILTLGMPSDYPPEFREISAACDFAISIAPDGQIAVTKDRQGIVPRPPTVEELLSVQPVMPGDVARILGGGNGNGQRPAPAFDFGAQVTPGPDSALEDLRGQTGRVTDRRFCGNCAAWHYLVNFDGGQAQMMERNMLPAESDQDASPRDGSADYAHEAIEAPQPDGWQGTQPAEGTRRATILDAIRSCPDAVPMTPLDLADRIESALLEETIAEEAEEPDEDFEDVPAGDFPAFEVIDDESVQYVSLRSILGIFEHLRSVLLDAEIEEEQAEEAPATMVGGGRSVGRRAAMIAALREDAATEADAEAAVSELERTGRAFLDGNGRHLPQAQAEDTPGAGFRVEGSQLSPLARFLDFLGLR